MVSKVCVGHIFNEFLISSPKFVFVLISRGFAFSGSLLADGLGSHGFGAGRVSESQFEYNGTLSFLFSSLEKEFTRVVSSLILSFKSLMSSALFCCLLARLCLEAVEVDLLVAGRILFSACSRLA